MASHEKSNREKEFSSNNPTNPLSFLTMNITVLVVDDDATSLAIVAAMLREWRYEVATAETPMDALAILRASPDDIDLVVTDLHMPKMNGSELQQQINRKFKNLPVIIMSSDDQVSVILRSLAAGAVFYMVKPINPEDLKNVWQYAIAGKKGKTVAHDDNEEETGSVDQGESSSSAEKLSRNNRKKSAAPPRSRLRKDDDKNDNAKRGTKRKASRKGKDDDDNDGETASHHAHKKAKVVWTTILHNQFLDALRHIGMDEAVPKKILEHMNVPGLTRENVASHLQKYRMFLKGVAERGCFSSKDFLERVLKSSFASGHPTLLKTAQEYSRMAELQSLRELTFHPGYGETISHRSMLFSNHNGASSSNSARHQHHGYGQSRLLGNHAANNYRRSVSGNSTPLYQGNRLGFANGSNLSSSLNGGFSGGLLNASNGLMSGANYAMPTYQHQFQARPNFYNDAGASSSSSQFRFGSSSASPSSNFNLGTGNIGTIGTSYPTLNSRCINNNSYSGTGLFANGQLSGLGKAPLNNGGYGGMNGPFNENANFAAMGNQTFHNMAQGAGSSSQGSGSSSQGSYVAPNRVSPAYTAANQQANTSTFPGLCNNEGASHYNSVNLMNNGGATHYNTVHPMNHASTVGNITPPQQHGDNGYLSDLLLESRNHQSSNQPQAGGDAVPNPDDFPGGPLFPEIFASLEDLLNAEFLESLSLEETSPRARNEQAPAQIQNVNEEVTDMDTSVGGGGQLSNAYYPTANSDQSTNLQQQSGDQLVDYSELSNIFPVNNASASESGNESSNNQDWGDDFVNFLFSFNPFDPEFE